MKLIKELSTTLLESDAGERQRARVYGAIQKVLDKEFSGNDALATDLLNGMMDFYDGHLHLRKKPLEDRLQDGVDALRQLLPRTAKVEANNIVHGVNVRLGAMLDATVIPKDKGWDVIVAGYKQDIPLGKSDGLEEVAEVLKDIARQGKKWFVENDPDGDRW